MFKVICLVLFCLQAGMSQVFYRGADLSYVNEMEDCGAVFKAGGNATDPYALFADQGCNLVRLRLWHNPVWYKSLNKGKMYSDLNDVKKSIKRAKQQGMRVLLDFHLSDNWADPSKQLVPAAWAPVVDNTNALKDSLYNYVYTTLMGLEAEDLLPEMVQIGNETNRGILLSEEDNAKWTLEWPRNAILFNAGLKAVQDVETHVQKEIITAVHLADPKESLWLAADFFKYGITDFDVIGLSYYWAWHKPLTIAEAGNAIKTLKQKYGKEVIIFETGYIWTNASNDQAGNIISEVHPNYAPASPDAQYRWLHDLTQTVISSGGLGVLYWEPAWVSTSCNTQWGKGSHQEHATFFDFNTNAMPMAGFRWLREGLTTSTEEEIIGHQFNYDSITGALRLLCCGEAAIISISATDGKLLISRSVKIEEEFVIPKDIHGLVVVTIQDVSQRYTGKSKTLWINERR